MRQATARQKERIGNMEYEGIGNIGEGEMIDLNLLNKANNGDIIGGGHIEHVCEDCAD